MRVLREPLRVCDFLEREVKVGDGGVSPPEPLRAPEIGQSGINAMPAPAVTRSASAALMASAASLILFTMFIPPVLHFRLLARIGEEEEDG